MLNTGWNGNYKSVTNKVRTRECNVSTYPLSKVIVDFRSCLFRYIRLNYLTRTYREKVKSVFRIITGNVQKEKAQLFHAALKSIKKNVTKMYNCSCTYVFPSTSPCPYKVNQKTFRDAKNLELFENLQNKIALYKKDLFDTQTLLQCVKALESYLISDLDYLSTMYSGKEWLLNIKDFKVPESKDFFESDRLCAKLATKSAAVMSADFDIIALFGTNMMIKECHNGYFVYVAKKDVMTLLNSVDRIDAIHRCCLLGTNYNRGLKGVGPIKMHKIDQKKAKQLFETCLASQSLKPKELYELFNVL